MFAGMSAAASIAVEPKLNEDGRGVRKEELSEMAVTWQDGQSDIYCQTWST